MTKRLFKSVICTALILTSSALCAATNNLSQALSPQLSVSGEMTQDKFQQLIKQGGGVSKSMLTLNEAIIDVKEG